MCTAVWLLIRYALSQSLLHRDWWTLSWSQALRNHIYIIWILGNRLIYWVHRHSTCATLQVLDVLFMQVATSHILICTTIASLAGRNSVSLWSEIHSETASFDRLSLLSRLLTSFYLLAWLVKVLRSVVRRPKRWSVKVVKHQIHVLGLFVLQIVPNLDVTMNFYFDMCISLSW